MGNSGLTAGLMTTTLGCDYDRGDNEMNNKLKINSDILLSDGGTVGSSSNPGIEVFNCTVKSGNYHLGSIGAGYQFYLSSPAEKKMYAKRTMNIEGGYFSDIAGGLDEAASTTMATQDFEKVFIRVKGGQILGAFYGAAQYSSSTGHRRFVITGGAFNGWIAGGANGTQANGGVLNGDSYIYVGGSTSITPVSTDPVIGSGGARAGCIFGAGSGNTSATGNNTTVGRINNSNIVIADDATIARDVYGGGNYGFVTDNGTAKIYITGSNIKGGVYGGSNNQKGQTVNIYMTDGLVESGIYGGSNTTGTINNNVTMQINGGQVGTSSAPANIHGGGYGQDTKVNGNVDIKLGADGSARDADGVTVWGDVYGGSALGSVNDAASDHTNVTMNAGYIHGSLYGGGLGSNTIAANVNGPVQVKVYGGSVMNTDGTGANGSGAVYGANNINGAPQRSVTVDIYGTNSAPEEGKYALFSVYGGGNAANYTYGNGYPKVTVHNCDNSIEYVYGGGNAAAVAATDVTIYGGNKIGNVFGGGNGQVKAANVTGKTHVTVGKKKE